MDWFEIMSGCFAALQAAGFVLPLTVTYQGAVNGPVLFEGRTKGVWDDLLLETPLGADAPIDPPLFFTFIDARGARAGFFVDLQDTAVVQWPSIPRPTKGH